MAENNICPGCGRHCDLDHPHCGRGEEYRNTGQLPEGHGKGQHHDMRREHYRASDINDKMILNLRDAAHMMRFLYEGKASQKRILIILAEVERITQRDLTERLGIQPGSASEILSKLESTGLISRTQNETDRRTTDICLTDTGRALAAEALAQRKQRHEEMFSCLSDEEKQEMLALLEKVCADWRERYCGNRNPHRHGHHGEQDSHGGHEHRREHGHHEGHEHHGGHGRHGGQEPQDAHGNGGN